MLQAERAPLDGPTILVVNHPARWLDMMTVISAFDEAILCLVDSSLLESSWSRAVAWAFGIERFDPDGSSATLAAAKSRLGAGGVVAVFGTLTGVREPGRGFAAVASLAAGAESDYPQQAAVAVVPVHLLLPRSGRHEAFVHMGEPVFVEDGLAASLERCCASHPFALQPDSVNRFLADVEQVMREELEEDWTARANWKQDADGFQLSGFVEVLCERLNRLDPACLVELREALDTYREARRRWALGELQGEGHNRLSSILRREGVWAEAVVGFPVALYGLLNHLAVGLVLWGAGLLRRQDRRGKAEVWFLRAALVLAVYAGEIALVAHWFSRSAAGYYAVSLPLSGAYLARYAWLWRRRIRHLLRAPRVPSSGDQLRKMRRRWIARFDAVRDAFAEGPASPERNSFVYNPSDRT